jgi:hypothetical protein
MSSHASGGARPDADAALYFGFLPVTDNDLAVFPHAGHDETVFAVAVGRLVQVHEIHVDFTPGQIAVELRMQMQDRFLQKVSPLIHILEGEKVWHQVMMPMQFFAAFASLQSSVIASGVVRTGLKTIFTGIVFDSSNAAAIFLEFSATFRSVTSPYKCWLPVTNQTSNCFKVPIVPPECK